MQRKIVVYIFPQTVIRVYIDFYFVKINRVQTSVTYSSRAFPHINIKQLTHFVLYVNLKFGYVQKCNN